MDMAVFIFTTLEPYLRPIIKAASSGLSSASAEVIDNKDQYEVFNDPIAVRSMPKCVFQRQLTFLTVRSDSFVLE
jgi:hypothetical protein